MNIFSTYTKAKVTREVLTILDVGGVKDKINGQTETSINYFPNSKTFYSKGFLQ